MRKARPLMPKNSTVDRSGKMRSFSLADAADATKSKTKVRRLQGILAKLCCQRPETLSFCPPHRGCGNVQLQPRIRSPRVKNDITNLLYKFYSGAREGECEQSLSSPNGQEYSM